MKTHATKSADSPPSTALKGTRPFSSQSPQAPASSETDLEAWQERASRFGHYFDGPAIQAKGEAAASGSEPVIQRNGDEIDDMMAKYLGAFEASSKQQQPPPPVVQPPVVQPPPPKQKTLGELARDADRQKLSGMFKIDDSEDFNPFRDSNIVSTADFDKIADLYSKIREGGTSIKFGQGQSVGFQKKTMDDFAKILQTENGRQLLGDLAKSKHATTLQEEANVYNAGQTPVNEADASNPLKGTPSTVKYAAGTDLLDPKSNALLSTSDTILFHELTHAHHTAHGKMVPWNQKVTELEMGLGHKDIGINKEEYATVGLGAYDNGPLTENAYRAEQASLQAQQADKNKYKKRALYNYMT